jgi:hypothetical protein
MINIPNDKIKQVYVMPFSASSVLAYRLLELVGVEVLGFCDNDSGLSGERFADLPILVPQKAFEHSSETAVIISDIRYYESNRKQLSEIGFNNVYGIFELAFNAIDAAANDVSNSRRELNQYHEIGYLASLAGVYNKISGLSISELLSEFKDRYQAHYRFTEKALPVEKSSLRFLVCVNTTNGNKYLSECLDSLDSQTYTDYSKLIVGSNPDVIQQSGIDSIIADEVMSNSRIVEFVQRCFTDCSKFDFIVTLNADDTLSKNALNVFAKSIGENGDRKVFTANEDRLYNGEYIAPYYKGNYRKNKIADIPALLRNCLCVSSKFCGGFNELNFDDVHVIDEIIYHYRVSDKAINDNKIRAIAFYLPQFHAIPENDEWWGEGFTEWTNVRKAKPLFEGHEQPRIPGELGYYDLIHTPNIQKRQMDLARRHGVHGFCYYYYWFNGRRLLEKPLDNVLSNPDLDMPFCICWANENWTRRWDGRENEILMPQEHNEDSDVKFLLDVLPILKDPRYIRVNNAPYLLVYRFNLFPNFKKTVEKWRKIAKENGVDNIHVSITTFDGYISSTFGDLGCDSVTEFPPHRCCSPTIKSKLVGLDDNFTGLVYDYGEYVSRSMNKEKENHLVFKSAMIGFDNTARRSGSATVYHGSTPEHYEKLMMSLVDFTSRNTEDERLIFINAWNEWAEGNHLEPDEKNGAKYLEATNRALGINCCTKKNGSSERSTNKCTTQKEGSVPECRQNVQ